MAQKKTIAQLSKDVLNVSEELKKLTAQLSGLKKGTDQYTKVLTSIINVTNKLSQSRDTLAKSSVSLSTSNAKHTNSIERSTNALEKSLVVQKKAEAAIKRAGEAERKLAEIMQEVARLKEALQRKYNRFSIQLQNRYLDQLERDRKAAAKREQEQQKGQIKIIEANEIQSFRSKIARMKAQQRAINAENKKAANEAAKEAKRNDFAGAFTGSFTPQKLGSTLGTVTRFLGIGTAVFAAVEGIKQITIESFKTFVSLEQQFASLSAISGATAEQMNELQKATFEVASSTGYTTSEIIQLESSLIKLGVPIGSVTDSLGVISMASRALGADLSQVGELLFKVSDQFGLTQSELGSTAATLVKSINESALSFEEFGTAIQYVGPIANQLGVTFQETSGYMEILSNAGFKASKIGTGLRDIFIDIKTPGEELSDTIQRLAGENLSLSEAVDLVGKTSAAQLFVLLRNADAIKRLSDATLSADDALRDMSDLLLANSKNMNTTQGRLNSLSTAWEAYKNRVGQAITSTELFIRLLGILDSKAEATARAYNRIANLSQGQFNLLTQQFSAATGPFQRAQIAATAIKKEELDALRRTYQLEVPTADKKSGLTFEKFLEQVSIGQREQGSNAGQALFGFTKTLNDIRLQAKEQDDILKIKQQQLGKYEDAYSQLEKLTGKTLENQAEALLVKLSEESKRLQDQILVTPDDDKYKQELEARLVVTQQYTNRIGELLSGDAERQAEIDEKNKKEEEDKKKLQQEEIDRLKDLIELRKREYQELIDSLEIEKELALAKGDLNEAARIEALLIKKRSDSYKELTNILTSNKIITAEQRLDLVGTFDNFKVNEKDIKESIERFAKIYKEAISAKGIFQGVQAGDAAVEQLLLSLESSLGNLSESDKQKIRDLINLLVFPDLKKDIKTKDGKDASEEIKKQIEDAINSLSNLTSAFSDGLSELNDVALENLKNRLDAEKEAIKERYDYEQKILESQVENQLITQEEYERKLEGVQKRRIQKENQINKKIFEAEKKRDRQNAGLDFVETLANITLNNYKKFDSFTASAASIVAALTATAQYGLKLSAINQRQFVPVRFAEGGVVNGPSHAEGGVPFTVKGRGGYEMEGGEFIVNKEATKRNYSLLRQINDSVKPSTYSVGRKFAAGGMVNAEEISVRQIELLENIAYATGGTYINTGKPVRAFVSSDDLRKSDVDLRVKERNSNL